jgi:putative DNA primase/helicase
VKRYIYSNRKNKYLPWQWPSQWGKVTEAKCPTWNGFIKRSMGDNSSLEILLQKAVGYTLTGDTTLKSNMFFLFGTLDTGKSKFIRAIDALLGDYALADDFETFLS